MLNVLAKERIIAPPDYNRWKVPVASVSIHLCIGSVYAWSLFNPPLTQIHGVVTSAAADWKLSEVVWIFSVAIVFLGLAAALAGRWLETVGPRMVGFVAACCWGGGFLVSAVGILTHERWLLYLGYGVLGGCGLGLGYVSPVSTLIRWFPDRRGMATGLAIMGFGGGAMIATVLKQWLLKNLYEAPTYLGPETQVELLLREGIRYTETADGTLQEVVVLTASAAARLPVAADPGVYLVGTGNVGVAGTFITLGLIYFLVMLWAAFFYRIPAPGWAPRGWKPPDEETSRRKMISHEHVDIDQALKTPQFYQLWIVLCFNVTAGIGVLSVAKTMMSEIFSTLSVVTEGFAATYVLMISVFNMAGRIIWASASDKLGRRNTYTVFFVLGILLYASIPITASQMSVDPRVLWLVCFYAATMIIFTMYGGGFATIPAYLADIFGTRFVGGIHGRLLTAWSMAGILGPVLTTWLRENSKLEAISELASKADPETFRAAFGAGREQLALLVEKKTVTLSALLEIAPPGTVDPTPNLYNTTMIVMCVLLGIALISNWRMRPVHTRHHMGPQGS